MHDRLPKPSSRSRLAQNFSALDAAAGEAWRYKNVRLYRADCTLLLPLLPAESVNAVIADPPYGSTNCAWDDAVDWPAVLPMLDRTAPQTAIYAIFACGRFAFSLAHQLGKAFRYEIVWEKDRSVGFLDANQRPLRAHELILIAARRLKGSTYQPQRVAIGAPRRKIRMKDRDSSTIYHSHKSNTSYCDDGTRHPRSVLRCPIPLAGRIHPTQKPLELLEWLVRAYTRPGDLVLDPWAGSGTTALACLRTGRRFVGLERDPAIYAAAVKRLQNAEQ